MKSLQSTQHVEKQKLKNLSKRIACNLLSGLKMGKNLNFQNNI